MATQGGLHFRKSALDRNGHMVQKLDFADVGAAPLHDVRCVAHGARA